MRFVKMHGIGNDYVYIDCVRNPPPRDPVKLSQFISDRHFGVGSDGLILICPSEQADVRMRMFNADGSEAEMCGNGVRCVAKFAHDHGLTGKNPMTVETGRGVLTLHLELHGGKVSRVTVDMGEPILEAVKIPTTLPGDPPVNVPIPVGKPNFRVTCVSMGNPHAVIFEENAQQNLLGTEDGYDLVREFGPIIEKHGLFPRRINVHFVRVKSPDEVVMRTWERGSGITLACGTGACAVAVAGVLTGRTGRKLLAHLPGGDLKLDWSETDNHVYMTGPAVEVFSGVWPD